jgi:hypothetical protein
MPMTKGIGSLAVALLTATGVLAATACGGARTSTKTGEAPRQSGMQNDELRRFDAFPLFWLGSEFEGLKLNLVRDEPRPAHADANMHSVSIVYGDCVPAGGSEPSCPAPLQITLFGPCGPGIPPLSGQSLRDAQMRIPDSGHLMLFYPTGRLILISSAPADADSQARRAAAALFGANELARDIAAGDSLTLAQKGTEGCP